MSSLAVGITHESVTIPEKLSVGVSLLFMLTDVITVIILAGS